MHGLSLLECQGLSRPAQFQVFVLCVLDTFETIYHSGMFKCISAMFCKSKCYTAAGTLAIMQFQPRIFYCSYKLKLVLQKLVLIMNFNAKNASKKFLNSLGCFLPLHFIFTVPFNLFIFVLFAFQPFFLFLILKKEWNYLKVNTITSIKCLKSKLHLVGGLKTDEYFVVISC